MTTHGACADSETDLSFECVHSVDMVIKDSNPSQPSDLNRPMTDGYLALDEVPAEAIRESCAAKSRIRISEIDPLHDPRWKAFLEIRKDASLFHRVEWLQALKSCYGYEPRVLSLTPEGEPLTNALLFCQVRSPLTGRRLVSVPFSDHCEPLVNGAEELRQLLEGLSERVDRGQWKYFEFRSIASVPDSTNAFAISNEYYLHRLDLRHSEEKLFHGFHKNSVQRKLRRAERESLRYEEGSSEVLLKHFYNLLIMTRRRQGVPPQPSKWFRSLISSMGQSLKIRVALKGETPVASILTISDKRTMVYKYGCSDPRFANLGGTPLLFWRAIQEARAKGMEEFDMGRSETSNEGLIRFKEHWGAKRIALNYWRYPAWAAGLGPERAIKYVRKLISITPDKPLVLLGSLLYPHIG